MKSKKEKEDSEYFDDCEICRAMKDADKEGRNLSMEELMQVFEKQNKINDEKHKNNI